MNFQVVVVVGICRLHVMPQKLKSVHGFFISNV